VDRDAGFKASPPGCVWSGVWVGVRRGVGGEPCGGGIRSEWWKLERCVWREGYIPSRKFLKKVYPPPTDPSHTHHHTSTTTSTPLRSTPSHLHTFTPSPLLLILTPSPKKIQRYHTPPHTRKSKILLNGSHLTSNLSFIGSHHTSKRQIL